MQLTVGYADLLRLCRIEDPDNWAPWLCVRGDGVYVKPAPRGLSPNEAAVLTWHTTGNLSEPALRLPCSLSDLRTFLEKSGAYGCIDPFDLADWAVDQATSNDKGESLSGARDHISDKLAALNQAAARFWTNAIPNDRGTHERNTVVADWLQGKGFSQSLAEAGATLIRPEWAGKGGRRPGN